MAGHCAPQRIRVNAIAPGTTLTPRVVARGAAGTSGGSSLESRHLLGLVEPPDVAQMAVCLASDDVRMVTGQVLWVDTGLLLS
jgi:NAD(P)-dependent dehydrogenase (short-subunit alcohol dehydrogenase family)